MTAESGDRATTLDIRTALEPAAASDYHNAFINLVGEGTL